jgi:hypothetical protein
MVPSFTFQSYYHRLLRHYASSLPFFLLRNKISKLVVSLQLKQILPVTIGICFITSSLRSEPSREIRHDSCLYDTNAQHSLFQAT